MADASKEPYVKVVKVRCAACNASGDEFDFKQNPGAKDEWTHLKVHINAFTAIEYHPSPASGKLLDELVEVPNPGHSLTNATISVVGGGEDLKLEPVNYLGTRVAEVVFPKGELVFPAKGLLNGSYTSPKGAEDVKLRGAQFILMDPETAGSEAGCCVIA